MKKLKRICKLYQIPKYLDNLDTSEMILFKEDIEKLKKYNVYKDDFKKHYKILKPDPTFLNDGNIELKDLTKFDPETKIQSINSKLLLIGEFMMSAPSPSNPSSLKSSVFTKYCRIPKNFAIEIIRKLEKEGIVLDKESVLIANLQKIIRTDDDKNKRLILKMFNDIAKSKNSKHFLKELFKSYYNEKPIQTKNDYLKDYFGWFKDLGYKRGYFITFAKVLEKRSNDKEFLNNAIATAKNLNNKCFHIFLWNHVL